MSTALNYQMASASCNVRGLGNNIKCSSHLCGWVHVRILSFFVSVYFAWLICMCEKHDNNKQNIFFFSNLLSLQFRCSCNKNNKQYKIAQIAKPSERMNSQRSNAEESSLLYDLLNWRHNGIESRKCRPDVLSLASFRTVAPQQPQ